MLCPVWYVLCGVSRYIDAGRFFWLLGLPGVPVVQPCGLCAVVLVPCRVLLYGVFGALLGVPFSGVCIVCGVSHVCARSGAGPVYVVQVLCLT